jgi:hypothetical protein
MDYNSSPKLTEKSHSILSFEECSSDEEKTEQNIPTKTQKSYIGVTTGLHMDTISHQKSPIKVINKYFCEKCLYGCSRKAEFIRHISPKITKTHQLHTFKGMK